MKIHFRVCYKQTKTPITLKWIFQIKTFPTVKIILFKLDLLYIQQIHQQFKCINYIQTIKHDRYLYKSIVIKNSYGRSMLFFIAREWLENR
jgi:hypothetical protein